jgi:hypothetical protein
MKEDPPSWPAKRKYAAELIEESTSAVGVSLVLPAGPKPHSYATTLVFLPLPR